MGPKRWNDKVPLSLGLDWTLDKTEKILAILPQCSNHPIITPAWLGSIVVYSNSIKYILSEKSHMVESR